MRHPCLQVMYPPPLSEGHVPPWPWGTRHPLSRPPTHTCTCAPEHTSPASKVTSSPGLHSHGLMPPPPQPLLSVSGQKVKCPSTPHLWLTNSTSMWPSSGQRHLPCGYLHADTCTLAAESPEGKRHISHPVLKYFAVLNSKTGIAA